MQNPGFYSGLLVPDTDDILQIVNGDFGVDFSHDNRGMSQNLFGQVDIPVFNPVAHGKGMSQAVESVVIRESGFPCKVLELVREVVCGQIDL
ncbi:MAG: hypothetical protein PWP06_1602, partial [Candidatus Marinimicrobia bacterium]|nr:hypothetical protein [Candidatus Neomarinimicrobiota bacterium]